MVRYRFSEFTLSPQRRLLIRDGRELPLIPRYFDLLVLLIERRREAVHRREILDLAWADVIVSESALSQAVRTIRRTLGDDSREPRFIRTVSRHGYRFVYPEVIEEEDDAALPAPAASRVAALVSDAAEPVPVPDGLPRRLRDTARLAATRSMAPSGGAALAGSVAGAVGGLLLAAAPGSAAPMAIAPVLAVIGGACGAVAGAGVGAGLAFADAAAPPHRTLALAAAGALSGGLVGGAVQVLTRWALASLIGLDLDVGGGLEGVVIGGCAGLGVSAATCRTADGLAAPRGGTRLRAALVVAAACGLAALALTRAGRPLAGGTIHAIATALHGSRATLAPLGRLIGEPDFGPLSSAILACGEGCGFGLGLAYGLMRRVRS